MLTERMEGKLNAQLNAEMYSGYLYLSMAAFYESIDMPGFASWMRVQRLEELTHALRFFDYVVDSGGRVRLSPIEAPPFEWDGALGAFEAALAHERRVTGLINDLVEVAEEEKDDASLEFLEWFVHEQEEEEETAEKVVGLIKAAGDSADELEKLDGELALRT
jgi:ferritin